jgi:rod shape-determining protein MreD
VTRRVLALGGVIAVALLLQTTVLAQLRLAGARPDLLVLAVLAVAMSSGPLAGAIFGFAAGLCADLLLDLPVGVSAMVYTALGYGVGTVRVYMASGSMWVPLALALASSTAAVWASGAVLRLLDLNGFSWGFVGKAGVAAGAYNLILCPLVYPLVRKLDERFRAERVVKL